MADHGLKISKPGFDIFTTGIENQIFNSTANSLKIWMTGSVNITTTGMFSTTTANVAHGLGYEPFFFTFWKLKDANKIWFQSSIDESRQPANFNEGFAVADSTNLILSIFTDESTNYVATAYYIIFIDKSFA